MQNQITKHVNINAPVSRVWRALTNSEEFGKWFSVKIEGPFVPGEASVGYMTYPGSEHVRWNAVVQEMQPENFFSYRWHPYAVDPDRDYENETTTLVEFRLEKSGSGTLLTVTESGFDQLPEERRDLAFRKHTDGWDAQLNNIANYCVNNPV